MSGRRLTTIPSFLKYAAHTIKVPRRPFTQSSPVGYQKRFNRGGQNLSERYLRLEETFRRKHDLGQTTTDISRHLTPIPPSTLQRPSNFKTFRGHVIPEVPKAPEPDGAPLSFR
jgi:hypothetical protein